MFFNELYEPGKTFFFEEICKVKHNIVKTEKWYFCFEIIFIKSSFAVENENPTTDSTILQYLIFNEENVKTERNEAVIYI